MFRIIGVEPHPKGAEVSVSIIHGGGSSSVSPYVSNAPQTNYDKPEGACLGQMQLPAGIHKVVLDYEQTKLEPGKPLYMTMKWSGGHCWGLAGGKYARPTNAVQLPALGKGAEGARVACAVQEQSINVNTATASQLLAIPGMDQASADAIVAYCAKTKLRDSFSLTKVPGFDRPKAALVAPFIKFSGETEAPAASSNARFGRGHRWAPARPRIRLPRAGVPWRRPLRRRARF